MFTLVLDELMKHVQNPIPWCTFFADDMIFVDENRECVNLKLEIWKNTLKAKGF